MIKQASKVYRTLAAMVRLAHKNNFGIACYRLPQNKNIHCICGDIQQLSRDQIQLATMDKGFLVSPFEDRHATVLIPVHTSLMVKESDFEIIGDLKQDFYNKLDDDCPLAFYRNRSTDDSAITREQFSGFVQQAIKNIQGQKFNKVVPARCQYVDIPDQFDLLDQFLSLCETYADSFISLVSTPETGTWMGASPEILVELSQEQFHSVALAGTQAFRHDIPLKKVCWTQKEIEEQAWVSRYIVNCFKKIRLREFEEEGPRTVRAGNLVHLKSDFYVDRTTTKFEHLGSVMLGHLHPTSAVCGIPMEPALAFLKKHEQFDRSYYSGFLGPVDHQDYTGLFVNLRCLQFLQDKICLYAGVGVTADSDPHQEWEETNLKIQTLSRFIN